MFYYDVFPKVVPSDEISVIRIRPRFGHADFSSDAQITVTHAFFDRTSPSSEPRWQIEDGTLIISALFESEQEHSFQVVQKFANGKEKKLDFRIFSLKPDWYALRPFKGDLHLHSSRSDGHEEGRYLAARYREAGFDFMALTDHGRYEPSLEIIDYWQKMIPDFKLFPGEEVHAPDNPVHIVNFGGKCSVNAMYREDEEKYRREVNEIIANMPDKEENKDYFSVAASEWCFERIRENEGLSIFCHPYWSIPAGNYISEWSNDEIIKRRKFDAYEAIGGFHRWQYHSNNLQIVRYYEELAKGNEFPIVGVSDSHGADAFPFGSILNESSDCDLFNWYYTIVLSETCELPGLIANIRKNNTFAVCAPSGERPEVFGSLRGVRYCIFLMREYFPQLRSFCEVEGLLMQHHLAGADSTEALKLIGGRTAEYREMCFKRSC